MRSRLLADRPGASGLRLLGLAVLALVAARPAGATEPAKAFLADHCTSCHNEADKKGRLDLNRLGHGFPVPVAPSRETA